MKKTVALLLAALLLSGALAGCKKNTASPPKEDPGVGGSVIHESVELPEGMSGIDAAKLILADERLNSKLFQDTDNLLDGGAVVFENLYTLAEQNMVKYGSSAQNVDLLSTQITNTGGAFSLSALSDLGNVPHITPLAARKQALSNGSALEIDGNVYRWSNFAEYSNSYDYFLNLTNNVKNSAMIGAMLIDNTKKYVRVVDTWVKIDNTEYYLHVEDNTEIIYCRGEYGLELCRRYKRGDGVNVYEMYQRNTENGSMRMVYIPGEKYEYSYMVDGFDHNFTAENTKGFWEVVDVGRTEEGYNVSCMVLKDDICYNSFYNPDTQQIHTLKIISSDRKTDVLSVMDYEGGADIVLPLQGFRGVDHVEIMTDKVVDLGADHWSDGDFVYRYQVPSNPKQEEHTVYFAMTGGCTAVLKNGMSLKSGDTFLDERIRVGSVNVEHVSMEGYDDGYISTVTLNIRGETHEDRMKTLEEFFVLSGLECRRDFETVKTGILRAYTELSQMTKYHPWNESPIVAVETLNAGYENNLAKHQAFRDMFTVIENAEVIDFEDKAAMDLKIRFAPITAQTSADVRNDGLTVSVTDLELAVEDTMLFVVGESYQVNFAIAPTVGNEGMGLTHIELAESLLTGYEDEDVFRIKQTASFDISALAEGQYTVVTYISTADNIRSSGYQVLTFTDITPYQIKQGDISIAIEKSEAGELIISMLKVSDVEVEVNLPEATSHTSADMLAALTEQAYVYGFIEDDTPLEFSQDGENWTAVTVEETVPAEEENVPAEEENTPAETENTPVETENTPADQIDAPTDAVSTLESGMYRLKYNVKNGSAVSEGYVYTNYTAPERSGSSEAA